MESFLQSKSWLEFQRHIGRNVFEYHEGEIRAEIIEHDMPYVNKNYLYIPHGPLAVNEDKFSPENFVSYLKKISKEKKYIYIKAEPLSKKISDKLIESGFRKSKKQIQPNKTQILNLEKTEDELLSEMHSKTRYNIRVAKKHSIIVEQHNNVETFWQLLKKTSIKDKFSTHSENYYHKLIDYFKNSDDIQIKIFTAEFNSKPVASALILIFKETGYYLHGASDYNMRAAMAPFVLHWEIIKFLKSAGLKHYDFWGIDEKKWPGVTRFKKGWGGSEIEYFGSFDLPINKLWYWLYIIGKKVL